MSDANDNEGRTPPGPRAPLTLKPRVGGSVASGTVKAATETVAGVPPEAGGCATD